MKAIILAGGLGTRLRARVADVPKPMAPVAGRPFLEYVIDNLAKGGITEVVLSIGHLSDVVVSHFGDRYKNVAIKYVIEEDPLGTGGAILKAVSETEGEEFIILNGDTYFDVDIAEVLAEHQRAASDFSIVLRHVSDVSRFGAVRVVDGKVTGFDEKGEQGSGEINAGIYLISKSLFRKFPLSEKFSFEVDFMQRYCAELKANAIVRDDYFIDIGIPEEYDSAQTYFKNFAVRNTIG